MKTPSEIYSEAHSAGMAAGHGCTPTPMVVGTPTTPLGDDIDYSKDTYYVADGLCGFAWINIKPARGKFVTWLRSLVLVELIVTMVAILCGFQSLVRA